MGNEKIRNVAIIAHVDHGKTTLMDQLMREGGSLGRQRQEDTRVLDSNDLEKERGITILSKCTYINHGGYEFNIVDTPGHADFGGEVERILDMVDGVLMLVDAAEGAMPQTKFVLTKALEQNLRPVVVINKMDKPDARVEEVLDEVFELFMSLNATDEQLDFPVIYASAKNGWAVRDMKDPQENMKVVFDTMINEIPSPQGDPEAPFQLLVTNIDYDNFLGRVLTGRVYNGTAKVNAPVHGIDLDGNVVEQGRITKISVSQGLEPVYVDEAKTGAIVSITGLPTTTVSNTVAALECTTPIEANPIDPPTIAMQFSINDSPLVGKEGDKLTSRVLWDRLLKEMESNVSIRVTKEEGVEGFEVAGRGELQLGVLIETLRREGFELSISRPHVIFKQGPNGEKLEPIEEVQVDVDEDYVGAVVEGLGKRRGELSNMQPLDGGRMRLTLDCPSRGLIGFRSELLTNTRGTGLMNRAFKSYEPYKGDIESNRNGVLISLGAGKAIAYSLISIEERGILFIEPGDPVYEGMIIGEHSRHNDLVVNPLKGKKLTNMRAAGSDKDVKLAPPKRMSLEEALSYLRDDERLEVTPQSFRFRKRYLTANERKRHGGNV